MEKRKNGLDVGEAITLLNSVINQLLCETEPRKKLETAIQNRSLRNASKIALEGCANETMNSALFRFCTNFEKSGGGFKLVHLSNADKDLIVQTLMPLLIKTFYTYLTVQKGRPTKQDFCAALLYAISEGLTKRVKSNTLACNLPDQKNASALGFGVSNITVIRRFLKESLKIC
jgi:hypothetical protein